MGQILSAPITTKHSTEGKDERLMYGASSMQGWRICKDKVGFSKDRVLLILLHGSHGRCTYSYFTAQGYRCCLLCRI